MSSKKSEIYDEILKEYRKSHYIGSDKQLEKIKKQIKENIDLDVYLSLREYDKAEEITNKSSEYIDIMLKHYSKGFMEKPKEYNSRVAKKREEILKLHNIDTSAKRKHFSFKAFGASNRFEKIKVSNKDKTVEKINDVKKTALKSPKKFINNIINRLKPSKSRIRLTTPKGFFKKLKEKKEKEPNKFKKNKLKALIAAGIISLSIGGAAISYNYQNSNQPNNEYSAENDNSQDENETNDIYYYETEDSEKEVESETNIIETEVAETETKETEIEEETEIETETNISETETDSNTEKEEATVVLEKTEEISVNEFLHSLISNLNIGFNTEFKMPSGKYFETPEGFGNYGYYEKFNNHKLKLTYIDAFYEDGRYISYTPNNDISINEIIAQNPNANISYHVETTNGKILRLELINIK